MFWKEKSQLEVHFLDFSKAFEVGVVMWNCYQGEKCTFILKVTKSVQFKIKAMNKVNQAHLHLSAVFLVHVISTLWRLHWIFQLNVWNVNEMVHQCWGVGEWVVLCWLIRVTRDRQVLQVRICHCFITKESSPVVTKAIRYEEWW